jgi:hypothetical protein
MKKKLLIRAAIGFLFGIAMMLVVPVLINGGPIARVVYSDALLARTGSPAAATLLTLLVMGLFGSFCFCGPLFYEIERWPLALATVAHYLSMSLGYLIPNWLLGWNMPLKLLLTIEAFMTLGFILIWLIMYLRYKREVQELNELVKRKIGNTKIKEELS